VLTYAREAPSFGVAVWHKHPGNDRPHVHIHQHESRDGQDRHHPSHDHDAPGHSQSERTSHEDHQQSDPGEIEGHWHLAIPAHQLGGIHALLILTISIIWVAISDPVATTSICRSHTAARAPPLLA